MNIGEGILGKGDSWVIEGCYGVDHAMGKYLYTLACSAISAFLMHRVENGSGMVIFGRVC